MGLTIIGTTALAGLAALLFCYRTADSNLRALTALGAARTVAEQVVALNYDSLFEPRLPVDLPASNVGSLEVGTWNERSEDFRNTPDKPGDDLLLSLKPEITRITDTGRLDYAQVVINYSWQERSFFRVRTRADSITMLVTPISFF